MKTAENLVVRAGPSARAPAAAPFPSGSGTQAALSQQKDRVSITLWVILVVFAAQAVGVASSVAFAWVGLGAATLLLKNRMSSKLILILEAPIFLALISYPVTALYLEKTGAISLDIMRFDFAGDPTLAQGLWVALGGMVSWLVGMLAGLGVKPSGNSASHPEIRVTEKQAINMCITGFLCFAFWYPRASQATQAIAHTFGCALPIGLFVLLRLYMESPVRWVGTTKFYIWLAALIYWSYRTTAAGIFGYTFLVLGLFLFQYARQSRALLIGFVVTGIILAPLLQDTKRLYRYEREHVGGEAGGTVLMEVVRSNFNKVFIEGDKNTYLNGITALAERLCTFEIWMRVKTHLDTWGDFAKGQTIIDAFVAGFVPRILWAAKPQTGGSSDLAVKYADMYVFSGTSVGVGAISEFYINGGTWAVLVGMLGVGLLVGFTVRRGLLSRIQPSGEMFALYAFATTIRPETIVCDALGGMIRIVFLWIVFHWWIGTQSRTREAFLARGR